MKDLRSVIKRPCLTEKGAILREQDNQILFEVDRRANKVEIRQAIEKIFDVKVLKVHTLNYKGKPRRAGRVMIKRSDWKKAYVTLAPGQKLDFFESA